MGLQLGLVVGDIRDHGIEQDRGWRDFRNRRQSCCTYGTGIAIWSKNASIIPIGWQHLYATDFAFSHQKVSCGLIRQQKEESSSSNRFQCRLRYRNLCLADRTSSPDLITRNRLWLSCVTACVCVLSVVDQIISSPCETVKIGMYRNLSLKLMDRKLSC